MNSMKFSQVGHMFYNLSRISAAYNQFFKSFYKIYGTIPRGSKIISLTSIITYVLIL